MLDKEHIKELYKQGWSYTEIGRELDLSRQRIHQIVKEYKHTGRRHRDDKYRDFGKCSNCDNIAVALHHKDFDNSNDNMDNLLPVCSGCHGKLHTGQKRDYRSMKEHTYTVVRKGWTLHRGDGVDIYFPYKVPKITVIHRKAKTSIKSINP